MSDQTPVIKRTRRSFGPKVSSGCITCKKIKCDERRAHCVRCERFGVECEGYKNTAFASNASRHPRARPLLPNAKVLCKTPTTVSKLFNTDQEFGYFQRFCIQNVKQLTGLRESEFWSRHVLQASEMEPCVRHAVIAIGALDFSTKGLESKRLSRGTRQLSDRDLFDASRLEFACREYGKSITCLRTTMAEKKLSIRTSLITSLLFVCFEAYNGNSDGASAQVYAGIEVMEQYKQQRERQSLKPDNKPVPPPIDDDIVEMFSMLEIQATSWGDNRSSELHLQRMRECEASISDFPTEFKTLGHASRILFQIALRGIHLRLSQSNQVVVASNEEVKRAAIITLGPLVSEPQNAELLSVMSMFRKWVIAYEPYYRRARGPETSKERQDGATMLWSHYLSIKMWVASGSSNIESYYRCYTRELREIVELSKVMSVENEDFFTLDFRIVMPLQVVALNYRHRALRQEVMNIFLGIPRREGMWDATMVIKILEWISEIEEEGLTDEEYIPEDGFATLVALKHDAENHSAYVQCVQGVRGSPGQTVLKETTVSW